MKLPNFLRSKPENESRTVEEAVSLANITLSEYTDEIYNEAHVSAERALREDDFGFERIGEANKSVIGSGKFREDVVLNSRILAVADGISKQSIGLYTDFSVGTGMNLTVKGSDDTQVTKAIEALNEFIADKQNKPIFGSQAQRGQSDKLLTDGELFYVLFVGQNGKVLVRLIDCLQIVEIATDPNDEFTPRFYKRKQTKKKGDNKPKITTYADWANTKPDGKFNVGEWEDGTRVLTPTNKKLGVLFHVRLSPNLVRSLPLITAQMKWSAAYRSFMRSRMAIQQGLARIIKRITTTGGRKYIDQLKARLQSTKVGSSDPETNPAASFGSTEIGNKNTKTDTVKQETGADAAKTDGAMLIACAGVAVGIPPHYFGYGEAFRLATATSMEVPTLKRFEAYRGLWVETYSEIFMFVLEAKGINPKGISFDINYPDIFPKAMTDKIKSITLVAETFPALKKSKALNMIAVDELGVSDSESVVNEVDMEDNIPEPSKPVRDPNEELINPVQRENDGDNKND